MRVAVLHNAVPPQPTLDEADVLVQVECVTSALFDLGHEPIPLAASLDLETTRRRLEGLRPQVVFNLVESLGGSDRLQYLATALMDVMGLPYTGVPTEGVFLTIGKLMAKERLHAAGLPTPAWIADRGLCNRERESASSPRRWIIKAVYEHASFGMEDDAVLEGEDPHRVREAVRERRRRWGRPCFAEQYIDGREFNLSLLARPGGVDVLPPAEIDFSTFPAGKPHIVGYKAKWDAGSFEFHHTPRRFDFPTADAGLLDELTDLSRRCWALFGLRGHVRVDYRIDEDGRPWILEINPNPCLSPDAGFAAALERGGVSFVEAVRRILDDTRTNPYV